MQIDKINDPSDLMNLEDWELKEAALQCAAMMAVNRNIMSETSEAYWKHLTAKEGFSHFRQIGSVLQSILKKG